MPYNKILVEETAWMVKEFVAGRRQIDIAREIGTSPSAVCSRIKAFCDKWSGHDVYKIMAYNDARRKIALIGLREYFMNSSGVVRRPAFRDDAPPIYIQEVYGKARDEHAWLLRAEGLQLRVIGERLGVSKERARQMISKFGRRVRRAILRRGEDEYE